MSLGEAALLGLLQGITEFLPVSSSGHLVIAQSLLGVEIPGAGFEIAVHVATAGSVAVAYRKRLLRMLRGIARGVRKEVRYAALILLSAAPAGLLGAGFGEAIQPVFESTRIVGGALLLTGVVLLSMKRALGRASLRGPGAQDAIWMGLAQAFAVIPGISRSGATLACGVWRGVRPSEAAAFSFLMSLPVIGGAALLKTPEFLREGVAAGPALVLGAVLAFSSGIVAISIFRRVLSARVFHRFGPYALALGAATLLFGE